jgi:hypothetical protein
VLFNKILKYGKKKEKKEQEFILTSRRAKHGREHDKHERVSASAFNECGSETLLFKDYTIEYKLKVGR